MVTQQEKEMLWECFGKGSGVEIPEVKGAQTREQTVGKVFKQKPVPLVTKEHVSRKGHGDSLITIAGLASGLPLPK